MNEDQVKEVIVELRRIADALDRMKPPKSKEQGRAYFSDRF